MGGKVTIYELFSQKNVFSNIKEGFPYVLERGWYLAAQKTAQQAAVSSTCGAKKEGGRVSGGLVPNMACATELFVLVAKPVLLNFLLLESPITSTGKVKTGVYGGLVSVSCHFPGNRLVHPPSRHVYGTTAHVVGEQAI